MWGIIPSERYPALRDKYLGDSAHDAMRAVTDRHWRVRRNIKELVRQPYYENSSIYLKLNSTAAENATLELMKDSPFTEELKAQIENISGVTEIYPSKKLDCEIVVPVNLRIDMNYPSIVLSAQPVLKPNWLRVICLILQIQTALFRL